MARRTPRTQAINPYRYVSVDSERAVDICETSPGTNQMHRVEPELWPPSKVRGQVDPTQFFRCTYCGAWVGVDPEWSAEEREDRGIELVIPPKQERKKRETATA